ncbi:PR domain zinc finger protein 15-like [Anthonomus grandis grandis]|uniref:PR domain zinc finger protein 15-like n=1 Tax=Anthonomus grandis grandis TaxID=2921223 RepID=UPI002165844E|nr:PR domain zinc finger protein 15-like [Anthonomus grandis grandis]
MKKDKKYEKARCGLCLAWMPSLQILKMHLIAGHSKVQLAREYLKLYIRQIFPKMFTKKRQNAKKEAKYDNDVFDAEKTETVFANESVQILCRDNDIIIRDDKSSVDMEFSFDENSSDMATNIKSNNNINSENWPNKKLLRLKKDENTGMKFEVTTSSSSASSEDHSNNKFSFKKRIRKRRNTRDSTRHYKINISRSSNAFNNINADVSQCDKKPNKKIFTENPKLASDTESASDTGRSYRKLFYCHVCGNGYKDCKLLLEHLQVHENRCKLCNEMLATREQYREHLQSHLFKIFVCHLCNYEFPLKHLLHKHLDSHIEDSVLESVIDMEEEYKASPCRLSSNAPYECSINSIMCYLLGDNFYRDANSNILSHKIFCDICFTEVYKVDYHTHMQTVHCVYGYNWPKE